MLWLQGMASFVVWLSYGALLAKRTQRMKSSLGSKPRTSRAIWAAVSLLGSALLLGSAFALLGATAVAKDQMSPTAWAITTLGGLAFVHLQTLAFAIVLSIVYEDVTAARGASSAHGSHEGDHKP